MEQRAKGIGNDEWVHIDKFHLLKSNSKSVKMKRIILVLLVFQITIFSCNFVKKKKAYLGTKTRIEELYGKTIILPDTLNILYRNNLIPHGKSDILFGELFIATRISGNCGICVHDLEIWKEEIMNRVDTSRIRFLFYIYTDDYQFFKNIIYPDILLDYPLLIDKNNEFVIKNHLPENDTRFHTFLLDENNRVILIGSPLFNNRMKELYFQEIERCIPNPADSM